MAKVRHDQILKHHWYKKFRDILGRFWKLQDYLTTVFQFPSTSWSVMMPSSNGGVDNFSVASSTKTFEGSVTFECNDVVNIVDTFHLACNKKIIKPYLTTPDDKKKRYDSEMEAFSSTSNISAKSLSNLASKDCFEISSSWGFRNCPWLLDFIKIWPRYWGF